MDDETTQPGPMTIQCPACKGDRTMEWAERLFEYPLRERVCGVCDGKGRIIATFVTGEGLHPRQPPPEAIRFLVGLGCPSCSGSGHKRKDEDLVLCDVCKGQGFSEEPRAALSLGQLLWYLERYMTERGWVVNLPQGS